ncbi:MAG: PH domain-containing protein [Actinomycetota bacterium]|nr:PH domain-containing protein [Actinomycetota bacterium]
MNRSSLTHRYLAREERVHHVCRQHWIVLARAFGIWLGSVVLAFSVLLFLGSDRIGSFVTPVVDPLVALLVLVTSLYLGTQYVRWWIARFVFTDRRVLFIEGLLSRKVSAIPLSKITDTTFTRSLMGRFLHYGALLLDSPGEQPGIATLTALPQPDELYRLLMSLVPHDSASPPPPAFRRRAEDDTDEIPRVVI